MTTWWLVSMSRSGSDSTTTGLRKVEEVGMPVAGRLDAGDDRGPELTWGDEFMEVVGQGRGHLVHREVGEDGDVGTDQFADPFLPGAVRMAAGRSARRLGGPRRRSRREALTELSVTYALHEDLSPEVAGSGGFG
ncbi:hypothetical protein ACWD7F_19035 [Streptomyces sp. NPDC005122]